MSASRFGLLSTVPSAVPAGGKRWAWPGRRQPRPGAVPALARSFLGQL